MNVRALIVALALAQTLLVSGVAHLAIAEPVADPETTRSSFVQTNREVDSEYVEWLESRSMLKQSEKVARTISGKAAQWQHEYAEPQPRSAIRGASVWLLAYPGSVITR